MKNFSLALILVSSFFSTPAPAAEQNMGRAAASGETWTLTSLDWPPFSGPQFADDGKGFHALRKVLEPEGIAVKAKFLPWLRAKQEATNNKDIVGYYPSWPSEVIKGFFASDTVFSSPVGFAQRVDAPISWSALEDLKPYSLATVADYIYPPEFQAMVNNRTLNVYQARSDVTALKMLCYGRIDAVAIDKYVMQYFMDTDPELKKRCPGKIQFNQKILVNYELVIAFYDTPENRARSARLSKALKKTGGGDQFIDASARPAAP